MATAKNASAKTRTSATGLVELRNTKAMATVTTITSERVDNVR